MRSAGMKTDVFILPYSLSFLVEGNATTSCSWFLQKILTNRQNSECRNLLPQPEMNSMEGSRFRHHLRQDTNRE
ncbi:hypothetical protein GYMLUDRAFT_777001 [Collybiopsis luxurians FD-317 M1]|uniref:Uncharacterized protein n=1 Tax=Collybiopsis luxurians FD-317 M1 TaxID=944289 RepID=A0A0D0CNR3_9AGAR|nr:hypothetical protein GYMLUDRAFT_777001 [Collybiopsis luxurians FD-317 M1]